MCVCVCADVWGVYAHVLAYMCTCGGQKLTLDIFSYHLLFYCCFCGVGGEGGGGGGGGEGGGGEGGGG